MDSEFYRVEAICDRYRLLDMLLAETQKAQATFDVIDSHFNRDIRPYDLCDDLRCTLERILERLTQEQEAPQ